MLLKLNYYWNKQQKTDRQGEGGPLHVRYNRGVYAPIMFLLCSICQETINEK